MTSYFLRKPVFAWVLAILVMMAGYLGLQTLPVSQYPEIAPTTVQISATYTGASADTVKNSVTQRIVDQMTGLDGLLYMTSKSSQGNASISLVFDSSVTGAIAQVEVQNKLSNVESQLPSAVQQAGLRVRQSSSSILMVAALVSTDNKYDATALGDILHNKFENPIERTPGVGQVTVFASPYAMRIWLDPHKLYSYQVTPSDVTDAVAAQNTNLSAGYIGDQPVVPGQQFQLPLVARSMLSTPSQFRNIVMKTNTDGSSVYLGDVAKVGLGPQTPDISSTYNGHPAAGIAVDLSSGANAVETSAAVRKTIAQLHSVLPAGVKMVFPYDTAPFVQKSIHSVYETLAIAIGLVFLVILVFLQSWRATIIPTIAVPIVLLGTFGILATVGMTVNTLTMFALVLAIGLLVDDAIVVVENVERVMEEENLSAAEATRKSMHEISGALVGIVVVLSAVFLPMAFMGGSTGIIYRQFSVTIISAMVLSLFVALILTPTMCATLLKPGTGHPRFWPARKFNDGFDATQRGYVASVTRLVRRPLRMVLVMAIILVAVVWSFGKLPSSFLPQEDQSVLMTLIELPEGSTLQQTERTIQQIRNYWTKGPGGKYANSTFGVAGFSFNGQGQNEGLMFIKLKDYKQRPGVSAGMLAAQANRTFGTGQYGQVIFLQPPPIPGMGTSSGFTMELVDQAGNGTNALNAAAGKLISEAQSDPTLTGVRGPGDSSTGALRVSINSAKAQAFGLTLSAINSQLSTIFAGNYVNDFTLGTKLHEVIVEGNAPNRMQPSDIDHWFTRNSTGEMVPLGSFVTTSLTREPKLIGGYGGVESVEISGNAAPGKSSGTAMDRVAALANNLPGNYGVAWTGLSYQEIVAGNQQSMLYALSGIVVFLCLAALYNSWTVPFAVMLTVPIGVLGAVLASWIFGQANDVYFKVGLLTTIGLCARNSILIVEFAETLRSQGMTLLEATMTASRQRLRPILMTSLAFTLGITPLALAHGAGAASQQSIGIGMLGGILFTAIFGIFFCPVLYVAVMAGVDRIARARRKETQA
ncbi:multidrug transporter [Thioclava dalianensis]|uniref:Efflux pump membrane transporter n=1 Tax=Thioclava dalianensis TaxID=1185766 RepID=A0A074TGJ4_9RHOB|nr:multidrug efflux RND transporter permease subunit [Thioclava dalianensis]KEP68178.1 multidrug transporter [Thioclava dalianensis]SFN86279.1 multidrug efflux pump [Thioclava dalianensis]